MKITVILMTLLVSLQALAGERLSTGTTVIRTDKAGARVPVVVDGAQLTRTCWYQGKQYSEGAPLEAGGTLLFCLPKNDYELNAPLVWKPREQQDQTEKLQLR